LRPTFAARKAKRWSLLFEEKRLSISQILSSH